MIELNGRTYKEKAVMTIHVTLNDGETSELKGRSGCVRMLPFHGTVEGEIFNGVILPGGVDTQIENLARTRHMSARYMLEGEDCFGQKGHIYVENNGYFTDGNHPSPFVTVPTFYTDCDRLSDYLHTNQFITKGYSVPDRKGPDIVVYQLIAVKNEEEVSEEPKGAWMVSHGIEE